jgi:signal recognition particle GTPase
MSDHHGDPYRKCQHGVEHHPKKSAHVTTIDTAGRKTPEKILERNQ